MAYGPEAFNLVVNSALSFVISTWLVAGCLKVLQPPVGWARSGLLGLPFVKALWECCLGLPDNWYRFAAIRPLELPLGHRFFVINLGLTPLGPKPEMLLSVEGASPDESWAVSAPDFIFEWLESRGLSGWGVALAAACVVVGVLRVLRRVTVAVAFETQRRLRRSQLVATAEPLPAPAHVDFYIDPHLTGTPFAGGIIRPYVCFPKATWDALSTAQRRAALAHELAHIHQRDTFLTCCLGLATDVLWFAPGARRLADRILLQRECMADLAAVKAGVSARALADALLATHAMLKDEGNLGGAVASFGQHATLQARLQNLVGYGKSPCPWLWHRTRRGTILALVMAAMVGSSCFVGNLAARPLLPNLLTQQRVDACRRFAEEWFFNSPKYYKGS